MRLSPKFVEGIHMVRLVSGHSIMARKEPDQGVRRGRGRPPHNGPYVAIFGKKTVARFTPPASLRGFGLLLQERWRRLRAGGWGGAPRRALSPRWIAAHRARCLFDEYKDVMIEVDPKEDDLLTIR